MFPAGRLPGWLAQLNRWLPFGSMATIMCSALVSGMTTGVGHTYLVVAAWAVASGLIAAWAVGHRTLLALFARREVEATSIAGT